MAFPGDVNSLGSVSGSQTLAAAGHATRHNEVKTALEGIRDALGGTAVPSGTVQPILAAGSASAPSLSFTGDSNTGLWSPAADTVAASTGGTERMRIDNAGLITGTGTSLGAWTAYTPTLTASTTNPTLGTGSTASGAYCQIGKVVHYRARIIFGTSGVAAGSGFYYVSLPVASTGSLQFGFARITDSSASKVFLGHAVFNSSSIVAIRVQQDSTGEAAVQNGTPFTWAASDEIIIEGTYQAS